jgi:hypothetical protein
MQSTPAVMHLEQRRVPCGFKHFSFWAWHLSQAARYRGVEFMIEELPVRCFLVVYVNDD